MSDPGTPQAYRADEMMTIAAARMLTGRTVCFVGIGAPNAAANLARRTHAPELVLVYESGVLGSRPRRLPSSIGDGVLVDGADSVVSVPEVFNYWLQAGRVDVGFLGAAQLDAFANINSTVIGEYARPTVRLPGAGGAPEIAASCGEVVVVLPQTPRTFVEHLDFVTSVGHGDGPAARARLGLTGAGPSVVITDLGMLAPDPDTGRLVQTHLHPGVTVAQAREATGWDLHLSPVLGHTPEPTTEELAVLRELRA